jgi:hypothetical protein
MASRNRRKSRSIPVVKRRSPHYSSLTAKERVTYERAVNFLSDLRRGEASYTKLLRKHQLASRTARRYLGRNLLGGTRGTRVRASKSDGLVRELLFPMPFGDIPMLTRSSREATKISNYFQDRDKLLRGKLSAHAFQVKWRGVRIAGREIFTDAAAILSMADADVLKVETLYASTGGAR